MQEPRRGRTQSIRNSADGDGEAEQGPAQDGRVPGEGMHVPLRAGAMILPGLAAVGAAHQAAQLDAGEQ